MNSKPQIAAIMLAAGSSSRMEGEDKLLRTIDDRTLLKRSVETVLASKVDQCFVVLEDLGSDRAREIDHLAVHLAEAKDAHDGMAMSLKAGVRALGNDIDAFLICLADMPAITPQHYNKIISAFTASAGGAIVRPKNPDGQFGHPVLFDISFKNELLGLTGDQGARNIFKRYQQSIIALELDDAILIDLDTPQAWSEWESRQS